MTIFESVELYSGYFRAFSKKHSTLLSVVFHVFLFITILYLYETI